MAEREGRSSRARPRVAMTGSQHTPWRDTEARHRRRPAGGLALDFSTQQAPAYVRIDGTEYELYSPDRLTLVQLAELERLRPWIAKLQVLDAAALSEGGLATASQAVARLCQIVLAAPADVQARLSDAQRVMILNTFR